MFQDKRLNLSLIISIGFHIILFLLLAGAKSGSVGYEEIHEITFVDQSYKPQVAKVIKRGSIWGALKDAYKSQELAGAPPGAPSTEAPIDLTARLDRSQAQIDLDRVEMAGGEMMDVIRIADRSKGGMRSTDEILAQKPIQLSRNLPRGAGGGSGTGLPGLPGIEAERPQIRIEHKPPPITRHERADIDVSRTVETSIKTSSRKGTQISVAGPIASRKILKKVLPRYPSSALKQGICGTVVIRLDVYPDGSVKESMLVESSSGYPDLDQVVIKALRRWLFEALPPNVTQEMQWGIITFRFVLS
ncbi:MAG TPA: energy transducer TonB [bacterium (Candidatus Stahlbacteria)]|nr:energy transducer TonB [Candidatus Stahlbacteria bacterium]